MSSVLVWLFRFGRLRWLVVRLARRLEGGDLRSHTMRAAYAKYFGVRVGMYTHGSWTTPYLIDPHTTIGRYGSIAAGVRIVNHNHPISFPSTSPLFFNPDLGYVSEWLADWNPIDIGNDVWIGANAVILAEVSRIGDGAVIGAGAVVNRDVPPYAVVLGNPARVVKYRFPQPVIDRLLAEKWWLRDPEDLPGGLEAFQEPVDVERFPVQDAVPPQS